MLGNEKGWFEAPEAEDLWRLVTGRLLGSGVYRRVFKCKLDPTLVVKVEQEEGCFHNVREWDTWQSISDAPKWSQWVAPCVAISPKGNFLLQKRTQPVTLSDIPAFFTDKKLANWGRFEGRVVCHDYGIVLTDLSLRMVRGSFWEN